MMKLGLALLGWVLGRWQSGVGWNAGQPGLGFALLSWVLGRWRSGMGWQAGAAGAWLGFSGLGPRQVAPGLGLALLGWAGAAGAWLGFAGLGPGQGQAWLGCAKILWLELGWARTWLGREGWGRQRAGCDLAGLGSAWLGWVLAWLGPRQVGQSGAGPHPRQGSGFATTNYKLLAAKFVGLQALTEKLKVVAARFAMCPRDCKIQALCFVSTNMSHPVDIALNSVMYAVRQQLGGPRSVKRGRKVWCNPSIKAYGYEAPFPETQLLRTVGVPPDEITITKNKEVFGIRIRQREADSAVVEDVNNMSPRAHIRHINKEVEALRGNKAMATEDNLIEMMDNEEPGRAANFQSQDWLVDKVDPEFVNLTNVNYSEEVIGLFSRPAIPQMNPSQLLQMPSISQLLHPHLLQISNSGIEDSLRWSFGSPPTRKEDFNQDKQVALRKLFNQHLSVGKCVKKLVNMASGKKYGEAYKLGTQLNDEMGKTFCSLSGWFESLEVEEYEPFDWGDSKGKRKDDCSLE
ncbi:hypothetical protein PPACK8108_LOCUS22203 [Phakopsora pachyrhizi]|uniref:Uncharacterized protein n=1 Tax=Phakopsora pachyrhizi TaxID=170000 RepID=A0AAV0BJM7_PHAPC|nr:hypothetical protein PPACK8108_LOCUS22203 [Phakopsora pachyrhizi]